MQIIQRGIAKTAALFAGLACISCAQEKPLTVLDAASIYEDNQAAFASIRAAYPGPFTGFDRLPARDPADETQAGKIFIANLRDDFPLEYIDFFPLGDTGKDEIDVILARYGLSAEWTIVSLVYSEITLPEPDPEKKVGLFDACDQRSLDWLAETVDEDGAAVFCKLNEYWYAYQSVGLGGF